MYLFFKTICDIGFKRIFLRLRYELRRKIDSLCGHKISLLICKFGKSKPKWKGYLNNSKEHINNDFFQENSLNYFDFDFLNEQKRLHFPINWNNKNWSRLWQFNLHYFDFIKHLISHYLANGKIPNKYENSVKIIDDWIDNNPSGLGDGWHSYTISLRIRNWIWFFIFFPSFLNKKRINSIWDQLIWLYSHPEECHGGNHWIENLTTLILGSLHFDNKTSENIYFKSCKKLKDELSYQILQDGGHQERSASYHVLILERLVELGIFLQIYKSYKPVWLTNAIRKMSIWLEKVLLYDGGLPRFNDCTIDSCGLPKEILLFAKSFLFEKDFGLIGRKKFLIKLIQKNNVQKINKYETKSIEDLPNTGWTILRPGEGWELLFKNGKPCPNHLPAHVHSDLLSFDLFFKGHPVFVETGTSTYENNEFRKYERSGSAHNLIQLASLNKKNNLYNKNWIESVEVWGVFRAARKAKTISREARILPHDVFLVSGSHDGFNKVNAHHKRTIKVNLCQNKSLKMEFIEDIFCTNNMNICIWFHLGPKFNALFLNQAFTKLAKEFGFIMNEHQTYCAISFGKRKSRKSISLYGMLTPGKHKIRYDLTIPYDNFLKI